MKRNLTFLSLLSALFMLQTACVKEPLDSQVFPGAGEETIDEDDLVKGVLRIKLSPGLEARIAKATPSQQEQTITQFGVSPLDEITAALGASRIERVFQIGGKYEPRQRKAGLHLWYTVYFDESQPVTRAAGAMLEAGDIEIAEPVRKIHLLEGGSPVVSAGQSGQTRATRSGAFPFNDPQVGLQWHYRNDGALHSEFKAGADINLFKAWEITTGTSDVIVAVIDSGIDYAHSDLAANMWVNAAEYGGTVGVDDDNNGWVDDIHGWNFHDQTAQSSTTNNKGELNIHGTHVAGTVAAVNNNGIGVGGVAGGDGTPGSGARIMACQINNGNVANPDPNRVLRAFQYAADNGAVIAQCSWGYSWSDTSLPAADKMAIDYFIKYAGTDDTGEVQTGPLKGGLVIFAAGNWAMDTAIYPAAYSEVLSVTAMEADFVMPSYAVRGTWVDVTAPGGGLNISSIGQVYSTLPGSSYGYMYGTSMACPHVSGVAALLVSKYGHERPGLTGRDIKRMIKNSTNSDIYTYNPARIGKLGTGYVDAYRALIMGDDSQTTPTSPELGFIPYKRRLDMLLTARGDAGVYPHRYTVLISERQIADGDFDTPAADVVRRELSIHEVGQGGTYTLSYSDLKADTEYFVAVKAHTLFGTNATVSHRSVRTQNNNPPADVADLKINLSGLSALATWSVTADPDDTRALYYNLSYSRKNLMTENWNAIAADITTVRVEVGSKLSGQELSCMISGLTANTVYYVAVQGADVRTNESEPAFAAFYTGSNASPQLKKELQTLTFSGPGTVQQIDLSAYFSNDDPLWLTYTVTVAPENALNCSIEGNILTVSPAAGFSGSGTITVKASDFAELSASTTANFSVGGNVGSSSVNQLVKDALTVTFPAGSSGNATVKVYNAAGNAVKNVTAEIPAGLQIVVGMGSVSSGVYTVSVKHGARDDKHTIVKL